MISYLIIAIGSAIGGCFRHFMTLVINSHIDEKHPYVTVLATLIINFLGSFIIGIAAFSLRHEQVRLFVLVGLCGGFTTFSAFSLQNLILLQNGEFIKSVTYILASVILCIFGTWLGFLLTGYFRTAS